MSPSNDKVETLFHQALKFGPAERRAFLVGACGDNDELRRKLEELLKAEAEAGAFLPEAPQEKVTLTVELPPCEEERIGSHIGRYKLLEKIGEGGFGEVWLAEQKEPVRRRVALKVIKLGMDTRQVVARFEAERQALALMDHPNIAKVLDAGATESGRPYFVMELVRGVPITKFCDENKLATRERLDLFIKVCHAVQHAHQKGIIHRDLKPSNVLVTLHDGVPVPKVIDFGIAKATQQELTDKTIHTLFQQFIGTPAYVSPEQAEMSGLDVDTRSDIYSLGVLLYELLTGVTPFNAQRLMQSGLDEMRRIIREEEPKWPSTRLSTLGMVEATTLAKHRGEKLPTLVHLVRGDLDWIVMKCLQKDRTRRYETASGLAADLKRHLNNEPVTARPPSRFYEFQKTVRRHKFGFAATAAIIVVLAAGAAVSTWQAVRARRAESKALQAQRNEAQQLEAADASRDNERRARQRADDNARELEQSLYLNRMALAHWNLTHEPPNIVEAEALLNSCKPELRGWEWDYLKRQWLVEPFVLRGPGRHGINSVAFSPDDRYLASAAADGKITVWDLATRQALRSFTAHTNGYVFSLAFDPTDSTRLVSAGSDNQVKLWEWNATNVLHSWPIQFSFQWGMAYAVAFSPDGQRVAAAVGKGVVTVWSTATGKKLFSFSSQTEDSAFTTYTVFSLAFSPNGQRLATGGTDGIVSLYDARSGQLIKRLGRPTNPIAGVAFSKGNGQRLTAASFDSSVIVWDVDSGKTLWRWRAHSGQAIHGLALSPDNKRLVTGAADRTVKLWDMNWDARTNHEVLTFRDFTREVQCASFSHDGRRLVACSVDGTIQMWDATRRTDDEGEALLTLPQGVEVRTMNLRQDGLWLAAGGERLPDEQGGRAPVFIWNSRTGRLLQTLSRESLYLFSVDFSPDGRFLAATGDDRDYRLGYTLQIWDIATESPSFRTEPFPGDGCVFCQSYSPDGRHLIGGTQEGSILVWDGVTGRTNGVLGWHSGAVFKLLFSPNGRYLASAAHTEQVKVWDGTRLDVLQTNPIEIATAVGEISDTLAFSPDSRRLVVATDDQVATVWDVENRTNILSLHSDSIHGFRAVAFSPDGRWIASGGTDCRVKLWDARQGELLHTFRGHKGEILRVRFFTLPEGLRLISGSRDGTIKYWDPPPLEKQQARR